MRTKPAFRRSYREAVSDESTRVTPLTTVVTAGFPPGFTCAKSPAAKLMGDADLYEPADLFAPVEASKLEPYTKKKPSPRHIRTDFVCKMCANTKNGVGAPTCEKCLGQLNRIMAVYTEAARMIPAVQGMKLSEFVERLWQREKRRRFQAK